ncbi:DUF6528 family protein [Parapedobacter tibetensis]|uniref:DUF6528 family protein n=1 Tax=Parapedobacter tibetensis TaxID=2972951 RepID=UPI00214DDE29|nr:DUF6528 family protein [Parapedobacter tibetensis]
MTRSFIIILAGLAACSQPDSQQRNGGETPLVSLYACGDDQVYHLDIHANGHADTVWHWRAAETENLPPEYLPKLRSIDDCKPSVDGKQLLVSSSSGATVLIDIQEKTALFYASTPNAHSVEFLPNNRIVVANSTASGGNSLEIYDSSQPEHVLFKDTLYSGHGVVWQPSSQRLYALGYDRLLAYELVDWETAPTLRQVDNWTLPDNGGHDLSAIDGDHMLVTTHKNVWQFEASTGSFTPFEPLLDVANVKSVNFNGDTDLLAYTKGEIEWWTHHIYIGNPKVTIDMPNLKLYKVRFTH